MICPNATLEAGIYMEQVIGVDPGRDKCGVAVLAADCTVLLQQVIKTADLLEKIGLMLEKYEAVTLVLGNGTTSESVQKSVGERYPRLRVKVVDEYYTTQLARQEYWQAKPPQGWRRLLPVSMQVPPEPVDDFVAVILARRYLQEQKEDNNG